MENVYLLPFAAAMIHWTRQIKEVLSSQDALQTDENSGPLEEIDFWKNRCADLSGISDQLDKPGVKRITRMLQLAKSSYVAPFLKLSGQIKVTGHSSHPCWEIQQIHSFCKNLEAHNYMQFDCFVKISRITIASESCFARPQGPRLW